jgi:NitT/TauT family transport system permease protein
MSTRTLMRIGSILVLLATWWVAALFSSPDVLPGPLVIGETMVRILVEKGPEGHSAYFHIGITLLRIGATFGAAMLAGIGIGLAMGLRKTIEYSMLSIMPLLMTIPTILMVFLAVLWFGFSEAGSLVAVLVVVTPFVTVNMAEGTKAMDKHLVDMAKSFKANNWMLIRKVYIPQLMPYLMSAFRYAFGMTWKIIALAETFGLKFGIGYMFFFWFEQFEMDQVLAWILLFVILMLTIEYGIIARFEQRAFAWRRAQSYSLFG